MAIMIYAHCDRFGSEETKTFETREQAAEWLLGDEVQADIHDTVWLLDKRRPLELGDVTYELRS